MIFFFLFLIFFVGVSIGSYIAGRSYRIIQEKPLDSFGRSYCPQCHHTLAWYDLIPLLSYLSLNGHCRYCQKKIEPSYFLIELFSGILFVSSVFFPNNFFDLLSHTSSSQDIAFALLQISIGWSVLGTLLYISIIDFSIKAFPVNGLTWGTGMLALYKIGLAYINQDMTLMLGSIGASFLYCFLFFCIKYFGKLIYKKEILGDGDLYLVSFMGMFLGFKDSIVSFYIAIMVGGLWGVYLLFMKKASRTSTIPFGPLLALGAIGAYLFGNQLVLWYTNMMGL